VLNNASEVYEKTTNFMAKAPKVNFAGVLCQKINLTKSIVYKNIFIAAKGVHKALSWFHSTRLTFTAITRAEFLFLCLSAKGINYLSLFEYGFKFNIRTEGVLI